VYEETLTGRPHDTSVQKAASDNENVDAGLRHAQDGTSGRWMLNYIFMYVDVVLFDYFVMFLFFTVGVTLSS